MTNDIRAALAEPVGEGPSDEAEANFTAWFCRNYPGPDTIIHRPEWHAPKVFRAAAYALARWGRLTAPPAPEVVPLKERPDFIAGYRAGLVDGRFLAAEEQAQRRDAHVSSFPLPQAGEVPNA
jgi:hypothetical protein